VALDATVEALKGFDEKAGPGIVAELVASMLYKSRNALGATKTAMHGTASIKQSKDGCVVGESSAFAGTSRCLGSSVRSAVQFRIRAGQVSTRTQRTPRVHLLTRTRPTAHLRNHVNKRSLNRSLHYYLWAVFAKPPVH
jgi:hypothetical protein